MEENLQKLVQARYVNFDSQATKSDLEYFDDGGGYRYNIRIF
jgi:hypothetical protein